MSDRNLISEALTWSKPQFEAELKLLQDLYYNASLEESKQIIPDAIYDQLVKIYESKFGAYNVTGAVPREEKKETLPFFMGSLSLKARTAKEFDVWLRKYPDTLVIMEKIDGISSVKGKTIFDTRGNGYVGTNLNRSAPYIQFGNLNNKEYARGEIAIKKDTFKNKYLGEGYESARNMIFGVLNSKDSYDPKVVKDFDFLAYRFEDGVVRPQSEQIQLLLNAGFFTPRYELINHPKNSTEFYEYLRKLLDQWRVESPYEIDGLVIYANGKYAFPTNEDPKHAIAFKGEDNSAITRVEYVEWNPSKWGLLKPRIKVEPVFLDGATIEWVSGHNARFIIDSEIGEGTILEIIRSGKVIPKVKKVLEPTEADLPDIAYHWNANGVEFVSDDLESDEVKIKKIYDFFKVLKAKYVGEKTVEKLFIGGFRTLDKFFDATIADITAIPGFAETGATRIVEAIKGSITDADLAEVAAASGALGQGFGIKKIQNVIEKFPNFLDNDLTPAEYVAKLQSIGGFNETAYAFAENIGFVKEFLERYPQIIIAGMNNTIPPANPPINFNNLNINPPMNPTLNLIHTNPILNNNPPINLILNINHPINQPTNNRVAGEKIVFSGFRDSDLEKRIKSLGGTVASAVSGNTTILLMKNLDDMGSKYEKAEQLNAGNNKTGKKANIKFVELDDFLANYV